MLHVTESKSKGLHFSVDVTNPTQAALLESILQSANVTYVKSQHDSWYIHFKVDAADSGKVKNLIQGWHEAMSDIQYGLDTRQQSS